MRAAVPANSCGNSGCCMTATVAVVKVTVVMIVARLVMIVMFAPKQSWL